MMEQSKYRKDMLAAAVFIAGCLFMILYAIPNEIPVKTVLGTNSAVSSRTLPYFACWVILAASALQFLISAVGYIRLVKREGHQKGEGIALQKELRALIVFAICVLYMILFGQLGFIPATLICPPLVLLALRDLKWQHYVSVYGVAAIAYLLFRFVLKINLP